MPAGRRDARAANRASPSDAMPKARRKPPVGTTGVTVTRLPFGVMTRASSASAAERAASGRTCRTYEATATSKAPELNGRARASAWHSVHPPGSAGTSASIAVEASTPTARRGRVGRVASSRSTAPVPVPRSSRRSSGPGLARSSATRTAARSSQSWRSYRPLCRVQASRGTPCRLCARRRFMRIPPSAWASPAGRVRAVGRGGEGGLHRLRRPGRELLHPVGKQTGEQSA